MTKKNSNRDVRESRPNGIKSFFVVKKNSFNEVDGSSVNVDTNSPSVILTKPFSEDNFGNTTRTEDVNLCTPSVPADILDASIAEDRKDHTDAAKVPTNSEVVKDIPSSHLSNKNLFPLFMVSSKKKHSNNSDQNEGSIEQPILPIGENTSIPPDSSTAIPPDEGITEKKITGKRKGPQKKIAVEENTKKRSKEIIAVDQSNRSSENISQPNDEILVIEQPVKNTVLPLENFGELAEESDVLTVGMKAGDDSRMQEGECRVEGTGVRRTSARLQQRQQVLSQQGTLDEELDVPIVRRSRKQKSSRRNAVSSSTTADFSDDSDGSDCRVISSSSESETAGKKRVAQRTTTGKRNPFFLSKAERQRLAAEEREQRIQESVARTTAENNKLFSSSADKNRKTAALFLPQVPSSVTNQTANFVDEGDGTCKTLAAGDGTDPLHDLTLVAAMIHVGIKEALMAINGHLEQLRTTANLQLRPSISNHKEYFNVKKTDNEVVADFSSDGWTKLEGKYGGGKDGTRRRNEDSALLPLSFQQHYWSAQLNFRHFWTLFCWTHSCSRKSLVDLTDSDDNAMCEQTASIDPREGEVTMLKWLEYWNMRRKSQKGSASSSRRAGGSLQECENDDRKTRRKTDAAIKLSAKKGRRPKRSKRSSSSEDDDEEEEEDFDNDEYFVSEPSQPLTGERFGDHLEPQSIMMIVEGPIASGKTSLVVSTASRLGMNVIEINSSQIRNAVAIKKLFSEAAHSHTIASSAVVDLSTAVEETANADNGGSVILFEEVDILFRDDCNLLGSILQLAKVSKCPIVLTTESAAIQSKFKALSPQIIELRRLKLHSATSFLVAAGERRTSDENYRKAVSLLALLCDGDARAAELQLQLADVKGFPSEPAAFSTFLASHSVDFALFDSFFTNLLCAQKEKEVEHAEEVGCILSPVVRQVEPRTIMLSQDDLSAGNDTVGVANARLRRTIRIRGSGFNFSRERITAAIDSLRESSLKGFDGAIAEDLTYQVEVLANEKQCDSVRIISHHVISAVLPASLSVGLCHIVVRITSCRGDEVGRIVVRSDLSPLQDCGWVSLKNSPFKSLSAPHPSSSNLNKKKPPLASGRRRRGRKKANSLTSKRAESNISTNSDADGEACETSDSQIESEDPVVSQMDDATIDIHNLTNIGEEDSSNLKYIRSGNKRLLRMHSSQDEQSVGDAVFGVAITETFPSLGENNEEEVATQETERESNDDILAKRTKTHSEKVSASTNRRRIIESDTEDEDETETSALPTIESKVDDQPMEKAPCSLMDLIARTSDYFLKRLLKLVDILCSPQLFFMNQELVSFVTSDEIIADGERFLDLETIKQSLVENLYFVEHTIDGEEISLFDAQSFVSDISSIFRRASTPAAAAVMNHLLNNSMLSAVDEANSDLRSSGELNRLEYIVSISDSDGGPGTKKINLTSNSIVLSTVSLSETQHEFGVEAFENFSALCASENFNVDSLLDLLSSSKHFHFLEVRKIEPSEEQEMDDDHDVDESSTAIRFLYSSRKKQSTVTPDTFTLRINNGVCNTPRDDFEELWGTITFFSDADLLSTASQKHQGSNFSPYYNGDVDSSIGSDSLSIAIDGESRWTLDVDPSRYLDGQRLAHESSALLRLALQAKGRPKAFGAAADSFSVLQFIDGHIRRETEDASNEITIDNVKALTNSPFIDCQLRSLEYNRAMIGMLESVVVSSASTSTTTSLQAHSLRVLAGRSCLHRLPEQLTLDIIPILLTMCWNEAGSDEMAKQQRERLLQARERSQEDDGAVLTAESDKSGKEAQNYGRGMRTHSRRRFVPWWGSEGNDFELPALKQYRYMSVIIGCQKSKLDELVKYCLHSKR